MTPAIFRLADKLVFTKLFTFSFRGLIWLFIMMLRCDKSIGLLLAYAFRIRYKEVLHKAHTTAFAAASRFLMLLTKEETYSEILLLLSVYFLLSCRTFMLQ
jgi:hypothetical protein